MRGNFKELSSNFGHWWVDDEGAWNFWGLDRPIDPDSRRSTEAAFRRLALHRLGMVQVSFLPARALIEFDLQRVDNTALDATVEFFSTTAWLNRVELRFFHQAWNIERHCCSAAVVRRITGVRNFSNVVMASTATTLTQPLSTRFAADSLLLPAMRRADDRGFKLTLRECAESIPHLMIYRPDDRLGDGHWHTVHAGRQSACAQVFGQDWIDEARGRPYRVEEPGRRYSLSVMKAYAGVLDSGEPRLDHIRGIMRRPGKDPLWVPYQRLLFRATAENGEPLLCCLSDITQDIAIPFMQASA
jgi:hypothetical protein